LSPLLGVLLLGLLGLLRLGLLRLELRLGLLRLRLLLLELRLGLRLLELRLGLRLLELRLLGLLLGLLVGVWVSLNRYSSGCSAALVAFGLLGSVAFGCCHAGLSSALLRLAALGQCAVGLRKGGGNFFFYALHSLLVKNPVNQIFFGLRVYPFDVQLPCNLLQLFQRPPIKG
jgi:hypothetical protein